MRPKTSRDLPRPEPRKDEAQETQRTIVEDADENEDRDLVHGDGGTTRSTGSCLGTPHGRLER